MEYKLISIPVPVDAEIFNDAFTPEENYAILKMGREWIIKRRGLYHSAFSTRNVTLPFHTNLPILLADSIRKDVTREIREKNRQKYRERLQELEKQIEMMKRELQKYGVIFMPASGK